MAVIISIQSNRIAEQQTKIAHQELLPKFHIVTKQIFNNETKLYSDQSVQVFNYGNNFDNFYADGFAYLELTFQDTVLNKERKEKIRLLPVYSYQIVTSDELKGLVRELKTDNFYTDLDTLQSYFLKHKSIITKWNLEDVEIKHYLKISYLSLMKERRILYYDIDFMEGQLLEDEIGKKLWVAYKSDSDMRGVLKLNSNQQHVIEILKILNDQLPK